MRPATRHTMLAGTAAAVLLAGSATSPSSSAPHSRAGATVGAPAAPQPVSAGQLWFDATRAALDAAREVEMPYAAETAPDGAALAFAFEAAAGQTLEIAVEDGAAPSGGPYVEVFRVIEILGQPLHERLTALRPSAAALKTRLPSDGRYHVLVQGGGEGSAPRRFTLELGAALPFPVPGARADAIRSLFGASRDAGRRHHEGVDIYVQRLTPVLAVAPGRAMPRQDALGGNTVWLNTPGTSYYYAHLDRVAVRDHQQVKAGDVLGYVGNTGNARNMSSHLHFGVYRWGKEPIDPLPLLVGRRFARGQAPGTDADAGG